jgi:tRNA 2-selenouridine synthase
LLGADVKKRLEMVDDFRALVCERTPLIDLRAPVEFAKGSFPTAVNLPLMDDRERELVGTTYKREGNEAAVELGHRLVSGSVKEERMRRWRSFVQENPQACIFCWRGGQRSEIVQRWLYEAYSLEVPRLEGGYKAFRNYLIAESLRLAAKKRIVVLGGRTGSGKTILLAELEDSIDLEALAMHRGSAFGRYASAQPPQIAFENALAYELITLDSRAFERVVVEDESRNIGQRYIPPEIFAIFQQAPVVIVHRSLEERVEISYREYVLFAQADYDKALERGEIPYGWYETMRHNFKRIEKRLGNERYTRLSRIFEEAWEYQCKRGDPSAHKGWIAALLKEYYDPMYDYQIEKKRERVVFEGGAEDVLDYLREDSRRRV